MRRGDGRGGPLLGAEGRAIPTTTRTRSTTRRARPRRPQLLLYLHGTPAPLRSLGDVEEHKHAVHEGAPPRSRRESPQGCRGRRDARRDYNLRRGLASSSARSPGSGAAPLPSGSGPPSRTTYSTLASRVRKSRMSTRPAFTTPLKVPLPGIELSPGDSAGSVAAEPRLVISGRVAPSSGSIRRTTPRNSCAIPHNPLRLPVDDELRRRGHVGGRFCSWVRRPLPHGRVELAHGPVLKGPSRFRRRDREAPRRLVEDPSRVYGPPTAQCDPSPRRRTAPRSCATCPSRL